MRESQAASHQRPQEACFSFLFRVRVEGRSHSVTQLCANNSPLFLQPFIHTHSCTRSLTPTHTQTCTLALALTHAYMHTHTLHSVCWEQAFCFEKYDILVSLAANGFITISTSASQSHAHAKLMINTCFNCCQGNGLGDLHLPGFQFQWRDELEWSAHSQR